MGRAAALRRLAVAGLLLCFALAGALAFAADLDLKSAKVTVFSNTLASPTLSMENAPLDTVQAGATVTSQATLVDDPEFPGGTATAGGTMTYRFYDDGTCTILHPTLHTTADVKTVVSGAVPASDVVLITKSGSYSWRATYSGDGNNQPFTSACKVLTVTAADPAKLVFSQQPSASSEAGVAFSQQPKVEVRDTYDNLVDTSTAVIHLAITASTGDPSAQLECLPDPDPSNNQAAVDGVATFSGCRVDKATAAFTPDYTLTASSSGVADAVSNSFVVTPGTATKLVITGSPTQEAGTTNDLVITARDNYGNIDTAYTGSKSLSFSGAGNPEMVPTPNPATAPKVTPATGPAVPFGTATSITFTSGVATVSGGANGVMTLYKAETADIAVTDGSISAAGTDRLTVVVSAAAANKLAFTQQPPASTEAGEQFADDPVVEVQDTFGNKVDTDTTLVELALTGGEPGAAIDCGGTTSATTSDGVATFVDCVVEKADSSYQLEASSGALSDAISSAFAITAGTATKFLIAGSPTQVAGEGNLLTITATDDFGNTDETYDGDKELTLAGADASIDPPTSPTVTPVTGPALIFGQPTTIHFDDGVSTGSGRVMTLYLAETASIAVSDSAASIDTAQEDELEVIVSDAGFTRFKLELTTPQSNGAVFGGTNLLTAMDDYGNPVTSFEASDTNVTMTTSLSGAISGLGSTPNVLSGSGDFTGGIADLGSLGMVYTGSLGTGTFTATAGSISDESEPVTINAGAATKFVITGSPTQAAGESQDLTITAKDAGGNTATSYTGDKVLTFSGANSGVGAGAVPTVEDKDGNLKTFGENTTITFASGVATVSATNNGVMTLYKAETAYIVATQGSITTTGTDRLQVVVSAGSASELVFSVQPSNENANVAMTPVVEVRVEDGYGNLVITGSYNVTLTISGSGAVAGNTDLSDGGVATFSSLTVTTPGTFTLEATSSPVLDSDTSASFTIT